MKRARYGSENRTDVCDDFARLTLVSIASATEGTIEPLLKNRTSGHWGWEVYGHTICKFQI